MHRTCRAVFSAVVLVAMSPVISRAAITVNSVSQGYTIFINGFGGGGNFNAKLPLININQSDTDDSDPNNVITATATQTITGYSGPAALAQAGDSLGFQLAASTSSNSPNGSATTNFMINFTLSFAESYSYTRNSTVFADAKLLYQGLQNQTEIAPGTGVLGSGTYIFQANLSKASSTTVNLQVNPPAPEPASLSLLAMGAAFLSRRARRSQH